jgi:hypothetical protein
MALAKMNALTTLALLVSHFSFRLADQVSIHTSAVPLSSTWSVYNQACQTFCLEKVGFIGLDAMV